jgi:hypothetical protein
MIYDVADVWTNISAWLNAPHPLTGFGIISLTIVGLAVLIHTHDRGRHTRG